jgi:hypothetical protein
MSRIIMMFAPDSLRRDQLFDMNTDPNEIPESTIDQYERAPAIYTDKKGEDAAEEAFDLTNNPWRQEDRVKVGWLNRRSLSVGDIVEVIDVRKERFLCCSFGWLKLS